MIGMVELCSFTNPLIDRILNKPRERVAMTLPDEERQFDKRKLFSTFSINPFPF